MTRLDDWARGGAFGGLRQSAPNSRIRRAPLAHSFIVKYRPRVRLWKSSANHGANTVRIVCDRSSGEIQRSGCAKSSWIQMRTDGSRSNFRAPSLVSLESINSHTSPMSSQRRRSESRFRCLLGATSGCTFAVPMLTHVARTSTNPAALKSPSNARASRMRRGRITAKLVASIKEYSRSPRLRTGSPWSLPLLTATESLRYRCPTGEGGHRGCPRCCSSCLPTPGGQRRRRTTARCNRRSRWRSPSHASSRSQH